VGYVPDTLAIVQELVLAAQRHRIVFGERIGIHKLGIQAASHMTAFLYPKDDSAPRASRPYGCSLVLIDTAGHTPTLFHVTNAGQTMDVKAVALGTHSTTMAKVLEECIGEDPQVISEKIAATFKQLEMQMQSMVVRGDEIEMVTSTPCVSD
jgi:20S proteasome alpha/beta subunit